jgi:hypothetical protein
LVGVGCRTSDDLSQANAAELHKAIRQFAQSKEGERILRSAPVPSIEEITKWIESA